MKDSVNKESSICQLRPVVLVDVDAAGAFSGRYSVAIPSMSFDDRDVLGELRDGLNNQEILMQASDGQLSMLWRRDGRVRDLEREVSAPRFAARVRVGVSRGQASFLLIDSPFTMIHVARAESRAL